MKLVIERSGGFAGLKRRSERDGQDLSPEQRAALDQVVKEYAAPGAQSATQDPGADRFTYQLEDSRREWDEIDHAAGVQNAERTEGHCDPIASRPLKSGVEMAAAWRIPSARCVRQMKNGLDVRLIVS